MILYHITTTYQLLNCVEHALLSENEKKIAVLADFLTIKFPQYMDLLKYNFFDEIYVLPYNRIKFENEIDFGVINEICSGCIPYDITDFEEIYVAGIQMWFSVFLMMNEISFVAFEEASGGLTRPEILEHNDERISLIRYEYMRDNHIYDYSNKCIKYVICNAKTQVCIPDCSYTDFDPVVKYSVLSLNNRKNILDFFNCPQQIDTNGDETIILTQQLANLGVVTFEEQILMYQLFIDFFCKGERIIFKTHPDDQVYYEFLFDDVKVINDKFPSELLPFVFSKRPRKISTIYSTGIFNISHMFEEKLELDMGFESSYKDIYKYDISLRLLKEYCCSSIQSVGLDITSLSQIQKQMAVINDNGIKGLINGTEIDSVLEYCTNDIIVFFDCSILLEDNLKVILDNDYNIHIVDIMLRPFRDTDVYLEKEETNIFLAIKRSIDKGESMSGKHRLHNTGVDIEYKEVAKDSFNYELLKGQLQATEERLKHYIQENYELKKRINEEGLKK